MLTFGQSPFGNLLGSNNWNFPGSRKLGFDKSHLAFSNLTLVNGQLQCVSIACIGNQYVSLTHPGVVPGASTTAPTLASDGVIGPCLSWPSAGCMQSYATGFNTATIAAGATYLFGGLFSQLGSATDGFICGTNTSSSGVGFEIKSRNTIAAIIATTGSIGQANLGMVANTPYFIAGSIRAITATSGDVSFVVVNLRNGSIRTSVTLAASFFSTATTTANWAFFGVTNLTSGLLASCHACMLAQGAYLDVNGLIEWGQKPFDFWYPPTNFDWDLASLSNPAPQMPVGEEWLDTSAGWYHPRQDRADRTWISFYNPTYMNTGLKPAGADSTDLPFTWTPNFRPDETWTWNYNPTYMNTGAQPAGAQEWNLSSRQVPFRLDETWTFNYNPTEMNTGAKPAGAQSEDLSPRQTPPRPDETWIQFYNPTQMQTGQEPFFQTDWPIPTYKPRPEETWTWNYNPTYMNAGARPAGAQSEDLSPRQVPPRPDETWTWFYNPTQMNTGQEPFFQVDWPIAARPRQDANYDWPSSRTQILVMPIGGRIYDITTRQPVPSFSADQASANFKTVVVTFPVNQYDWPLPTRSPRLDATWIEFYNPTQMQTGAKPTFSTEWPLPTPRYRIDANWSWPSPPGYFPVVSVPPFVYDWPLPIRPPLLVYGGNHPRGYAPVIVSAPFTYDWPLPIIAQQPLRGSSYRRAYPQAQKPFFQSEWPLPRVAPPIDPTWDYPYDPIYIQTGGKPVFSQEWPLPIVAQQPIRGNIYGRTIAPFGQPFYPFDVSLPGRYPVPDSTWLQFYNPTQMATGKKPFSQTDWPLPTPPFRLDQTWTWESPNIAFINLPPGHPYDWPLPGRHPRIDATWIDFYNPTQMQTGSKPFSQLDWPLPRIPPRLDLNLVANPLPITAVIFFPAGKQLYDLPWQIDPGAFKRGSSYARRFIQASQPFNQTDWPLPTAPFRPSFNFQQSNPFITILQIPPSQHDWPLPIPPFRPNFNYQFYYVIEQLISPPFFQADWPLPVVASQFNRTYELASTARLIVTLLPPNQYDWPLPKAPFRIEQSTSQFYNPTQMGTGARPTNQYDWPLPSPDKRGGIDIYTVTGPNNPNIYAPTVKPTIKVEWLIRARRRGRR